MKKVVELLKNKNVLLGSVALLSVMVLLGQTSKLNRLLSNSVGKVVVYGLIVFVSQHNMQLALVLTLALFSVNTEGLTLSTNLENTHNMDKESNNHDVTPISFRRATVERVDETKTDGS